ncbi:MAG: response regulator [Alphaproteobacteria bacterium]|nr:MAG: response regulator [Alphaproteobacteria bacterium]
MESRLPQPFRDALIQSEAKSGLRLMAIALAGLLGAAGAGFMAWIAWGLTGALGAGSLVLVATAFTLLKSLSALDEPMTRRDLLDRELLQALVGLERRALLVTDLGGQAIASNPAFERLMRGRAGGLQALVGDENARNALQRLIAGVRQSGVGQMSFSGSGDDGVDLTISGRRVGQHALWQVVSETDGERLQNERRLIEDWGDPLFERLGCGISLEDNNGRIQYINKTLRDWLELDEDAPLPSRIQLKAGESQLLVGKKRRIDVDVVDMPLKTREQNRDIGRYRFIRRLDQIRGRLVPVERQFLIDPIFDAAPVAIAITNREGVVQEFNQPLKRHPSGKNIKQGDSVQTLVKIDDRDELTQLIAYAYDGKPASHPLDVVYNTQPERVGQVFSSSITKGDEHYAILYLIDTTQEKSLERQFVQAQKMQAVGQLAGGVAHDFNNLLTAIIGFCDLLLVRHDAGDQSFSDIIQIKQNANRAANLVRQLLAFSRQQTLRPKVLMMTDVLAELSNLIRRLIGENIELRVVHGRDLKPVKVDQGQLEQVIINLAVNARDAMPNGGKLEVRTSMIGPDHPLVERYDVIVPDDYVLVEVEDTGCGIPKDNLNKIFEPFFTTKEVGQGTGLGLATVYGIVKQTGGFVFVESQVGQGTTFLLFFKAHAAEAAERKDSQKPEAPARDLTGKGTILIVEDEDPVRMFASRALVNKGYKVLEAASGEAGLEILNTTREHIDLLISDVIMPNMDGPTLVKEARKDRPDLPVIFVSGYAEDMIRKNLEAEEFQFLPKPFSLKDLAEQVKTILG